MPPKILDLMAALAGRVEALEQLTGRMEPENIDPMIQVIQAAEANIIRVRDQHIHAAKVLLKKSDEKEAALRTLLGVPKLKSNAPIRQ